MLSDADLPEEVRNDPNLREYTGGFDSVSRLLGKEYPPYPFTRTEVKDAEPAGSAA